jgi:hypothetical protein
MPVTNWAIPSTLAIGKASSNREPHRTGCIAVKRSAKCNLGFGTHAARALSTSITRAGIW